MTQTEVRGHRGTAQIEETMSQSEILIGDPLIHGEGWHLGAVQHGERRGNKFNGTGRKLEVLRSCKTGRNRTAHRDHILRAESVRGGGGLRAVAGRVRSKDVFCSSSSSSSRVAAHIAHRQVLQNKRCAL